MDNPRDTRPPRDPRDKPRRPASTVGAPTSDEPRGPRRRKSILVDPNEPPEERKARRRSQSQTRARLQSPPSDESITGRYIRHRDGTIDFMPDGDEARKKPHDAERKTAPRNLQFREKRNGYESEEGEILRKGKGRGDVSDDGDLAGAVRAPPPRRGGGERSLDDDRPRRPPPQRRRSRPPPPPDLSDDDDIPPRRPPPRRRTVYPDEDDYLSDEPPRRRRPPYDSDIAPPRYDRLPVRSRYDDDDYDDRRGGGGLRRSKSDRRYRGDELDRYRDDGRRPPRNAREREEKKKDDWKKQLMAQAMPVVKQEGGKFIKEILAQQMQGR